MITISSIKYLILLRFGFWCFFLILSSITSTIFILQTWSKMFIIVLILNVIFCLINFFLYKNYYYYQKFKYILVSCLFLLIVLTLIIYSIYLFNIYFNLMNLHTINIMINDRNESLLSQTLNHYQCCRIQDDILFDSVNERDYFLAFPYCEKVILEYEIQKEHWNNIKACGPIFRSIIFYIRTFFIIDFLFDFFLLIQNIIYILDEEDRRLLSLPKHINHKIN